MIEKLKTVLYDQQYEGLESMPEALQDMWDRRTWGKAIIKIPSAGKL
jgi:NADPH-dependent curcumin reductase CurA